MRRLGSGQPLLRRQSRYLPCWRLALPFTDSPGKPKPCNITPGVCHERELGRPRKEAHWLERAVQDLDCALDQWQQVFSWLDLAGNDDEQQDPASLDTIRLLMRQANEHQARRRTLHR